MRQIYALYDNVAKAIIGGLSLHYHDAPAIRMYSDIATMPQSTVGMHPADYDLLHIGSLSDEGIITPVNRTVITGAQWLASQQPTGEKQDAS